MLACINGAVGGSVELSRGEDQSLNAFIMNDDGSKLDLTADTIGLELYDRSDRANAVTATLAGTLVTAAAGYVTFAAPHATTAALVAGGTYYGFVKRDVGAAGTNIKYGHMAVVVRVK